jgi:phosphohistidine swiveling domain-containing protein
VSPREIPGVLLVGSPSTSVRGIANHTGRPLPGSVLVVDVLGPELYDTIVKSAAVVCSGGGRTGHMESLCRSRGIPVLRIPHAELAGLVGNVTVRTDRESVTLGEADVAAQSVEYPTVTPEDLRSVCVVIADATDIQSTNAIQPRVDQVTSFFIREEFVCLSSGLSPLDALRAGIPEAERYGAAIGAELCAIVKELLPGQRLVMRLLDLRSVAVSNLPLVVDCHHESNPELGLHGARWLLHEPHYPHAFRALRAYVRERLGPEVDRVSFAVPFINDEDEFLRLRDRLELPDDVPLSVFVETPAAVHSVTGFCEAGASEIFMGTKDLTQFYLAADRGNHRVASSYQTRHPAVMSGLRQSVEAGRRAGVPVHVFALGADVGYYFKHLPTDRFMMCTAELRQLAVDAHESR